MTCFALSFLSEGFSATSIICVGPGSGLYHIRASTLLRECRAATIVCFVMVWAFVCASRTHLHGPARSLSLSLSLSLSRLLLLTLWGPVWFLLLVCLVSCLPFFSCAEPVWFLLLFSLGLRWPFASMLSFGGARVVFAAAFRLLLVFACPLLALLGFLPWFGPAASAAVVPVLCAPLGAPVWFLLFCVRDCCCLVAWFPALLFFLVRGPCGFCCCFCLVPPPSMFDPTKK